MALGQELQDFVGGFKAGRAVVEDGLDRKDRKEAREDAAAEREADKAYRRDRDAAMDSRYATALERDLAKDARQERRWGVEDQRAADAAARDERRIRLYERGQATKGAGDTLDPEGMAIPEGSTDIDSDTTGSVEKVSALYNPPWLTYDNQGATRSMPLSTKLVSTLDKVVPQLGDGVKVRVFSGGQPSEGPNRTGSHRHDHGGAGDIFLEKDGKRLSWENPNDRPYFEKFVSLGRQAGLTGFGAGDGYMQSGSMHVGFGNPGVWGAGGSGSNAAPWLVNAYNSAAPKNQQVAGYKRGGMVHGFSLGGAIPDDEEEDQYEPTPIPVSMLEGATEEAPPQQVAEAIPTGEVPTPMPRPEYDGAVTSQGNQEPQEEPTDDPYELGRRSVRDGLKRALQDAGVNDQGAIDDPQSDDSQRKYLGGSGAAPRTLVQQALKLVDPDKKMRPGERNMAAFAQVYKHYMNNGEPEKAQKAAASMVQYYRQESNRYLSLSQVAAGNGDLEAARKAAMAAYANIPNGRDLEIKPVDGGYEVKVTNQDGKVINKKVVDPREFAAAAMGFSPATFDEEILNAAGEKGEEFKDPSVSDIKTIGEGIDAYSSGLEDPKLADKQVVTSLKNVATSIAADNGMPPEQAFDVARSLASSDMEEVKKSMRPIRGTDRVRMTVDGQTVVVKKNAVASLLKTAEVKSAEEAEAKKNPSGYKKGFKSLKEAAQEFRKAADDASATQRGAAVGAAVGAAAHQAEDPTAIPEAPSWTAPSVGDTGGPAAVPSWDAPAGGGVAIPDGGPQGDFKGMVTKGNIDLNKRPKVENPDGSVSTVRSITITDDQGKAILIPTISPSGTTLTDEGAIALYQQTGQHLGVFDNEKDAETYAQALHQSQAARYAPN